MSLAHLLTPEELEALAAMFKKLAAIGVMSLAGSTAQAQARDKWGQDHVWFHFAGEAVAGTAAGYLINNKWAAFAVAEIPAVLREEYKRRRGFDHWAPSRVVPDLIGGALGVYTGRCVFRMHSVACSVEF